ncbi:NAD(P)H-quinone oxidoreductase [Methylotetracoccus oryzae]
MTVATMRVIEITEPGGAEVLRLAERPLPVPRAGEVLIRVQAAGINRPDILQRCGLYPPPPGASDIPGLEVAGEIAALGPDAGGWSIGDRVCALVTGGGYAEYCTAASALCLPIPEGLTATDAASLPEALFTVWNNVFDRGGLQSGEHFLVHGGTSGIGVAAIQLARAAGAVVYATAGSSEKCRACVALGAQAINYREEDFVARVDALTGGRGVDVLLDMVGGDYLPRNLACLAEGGRLVQIAVQHGAKAELDLFKLMVKRLTVTGSTLRPRPVAEKARIAVSLAGTVWPWLVSRSVRPVVDRVLPLAQAAEAHRLMEAGQHVGKLVLQVVDPI